MSDQSQPSLLITVTDAAKLSGLPRATLYRLAADPAQSHLFHRIGRSVWVRRETFMAWLSGNGQAPEDEKT